MLQHHGVRGCEQGCREVAWAPLRHCHRRAAPSAASAPAHAPAPARRAPAAPVFCVPPTPPGVERVCSHRHGRDGVFRWLCLCRCRPCPACSPCLPAHPLLPVRCCHGCQPFRLPPRCSRHWCGHWAVTHCPPGRPGAAAPEATAVWAVVGTASRHCLRRQCSPPRCPRGHDALPHVVPSAAGQRPVVAAAMAAPPSPRLSSRCWCTAAPTPRGTARPDPRPTPPPAQSASAPRCPVTTGLAPMPQLQLATPAMAPMLLQRATWWTWSGPEVSLCRGCGSGHGLGRGSTGAGLRTCGGKGGASAAAFAALLPRFACSSRAGQRDPPRTM